MGRNLNRVSEAIHSEYLAKERVRLEKRASKDISDRDSLAEQIKHAWLIGRYSFEVGATLYQQEGSFAEIRILLHQAAESWLRAHELRGPPAHAESRDVWLFVKTAQLAVCCCPTAIRSRIIGIDEIAYREPPELDHDGYDVAPIAYAALLKRYLAGDDIDIAELDELASMCQPPRARGDWTKALLPEVRALTALCRRDQAGLEGVLSEMLAVHEHDAYHTDFGEMSESLLCLPAMMFVKLGREAGIAPSVSSKYVPVELFSR